MSKPANPTVIGSFVVAAVALMVIGIMVFGGGKFFSKTKQFVAFFHGSVYGLNVGAPVNFRGVKIGSVVDIDLVINTQTVNVDIPVIMEISQDAFTEMGGESQLTELSRPELLEYLINQQGLRAQLQLQSLVTGQLYVELDFHPNTPVKLLNLKSQYQEVPTIASGLQKLGQSIEALPLDQLANQALDTLSGIDRAVNAPEIPAILKNLEDMTLNLQQVISRIDQEFAPLIKSLIATSDTARGTLMQLDETISQYKGIPEQITPSIKQAADAIDTAAQQAQDTLASVETLTAEDSPLQSRLQTALNELAAAARSLRIMADYLERHPEALLRGKRY